MIQQTIAECFKSEPNFTLKQATEAVLAYEPDINPPSIRARIYEGIEKGFFEKISRGVYKCTQDGITCLCVIGDGRDLSRVKANSVDAIITDHPYGINKALKGGNRDFAKYDLFTYTQEDFNQKARVLKDGAFCCEFLPEESEANFEYLHEIKKMAEKAGFKYYAKVPWKKGNFVANTGRKSKATEDIMIFTKGKARNLRPDAKKDMAEPEVKHFMSGTAKMLPVEFNYQPPSKKERVHQAEKPVELIEELIELITLPGEKIIDQFAGSGSTGIAAINKGRKVLLFEKDETVFNAMLENIQKHIS